jgi:hypothetical protein
LAYRTRISRRPSFDDIFAIRIAGATIEKTESSAFFHHGPFFTKITHYAGIPSLFFFGIGLDEFAFWIIGAGNKDSKLALSLYQTSRFTFWTLFARFFRAFQFFSFNSAGTVAVRIIFA